jgi:uncharacterized protein YbjT (DUF2867 family)
MKKFVITGSVGHIGKLVTTSMVEAGNEVSVITRSTDNAQAIAAVGAKPLVGTIEDSAFLSEAFSGADAVFTMVPPIWHTEDLRTSQNKIGRSYTNAIRLSGIRNVVNLSSVGAHVGNGCGPIDGLADFERMLNEVEGLNVLHVRPAYFYLNLLNQIPLIKQAGIMGANYGVPGEKMALVHVGDIAKVAADALRHLNFKGSAIRYVVGDKKTAAELADIIGQAIGKQLNWVVFSDEEQKNSFLQAGLPKAIAGAYTQMGAAIRQGIVFEEALTQAEEHGAVTFQEYVEEFKSAFEQS